MLPDGGSTNVVLYVFLTDQSVRRQVEEHLIAGGYNVLRDYRVPEEVPKGVVAGIMEISNTERELLESLALYDRATQIATAIGISPRSVDSRLQRLMARFGVHSRHRLIAQAIALGLITVEPDRNTRWS